MVAGEQGKKLYAVGFSVSPDHQAGLRLSMCENVVGNRTPVSDRFAMDCVMEDREWCI